MAQYGCSIGMRVDAYRIILTFPYFFKPAQIEAAIRKLEGEYIEELLERTLPQTTQYEWRFIHIAKRFGVIRGPWESGKVHPRYLTRAYQGTLVEKATIQELIHDKMDIDTTKEIIKAIKNQEIDIVGIHKPKMEEISPIAKAGINLLRFTGFVMPTKPDKQLAKKVQERLQNKEVRLICMWCGEYNVISKIRNIDDKPKCPKCGARYLAAVSPYNRELHSILRRHQHKQKISNEENKKLQRGYKSADLVIASGKKAIIALAARGIGPRSASRVLQKSDAKGDYEFYAEIIKAEKEYSRTRPFWGD
jgi:ATP-dependent Lhr-like helicase